MPSPSVWTFESRKIANKRRNDSATYTTPLLIHSSDAVLVTDFMSDFNRNLEYYESEFSKDLELHSDTLGKHHAALQDSMSHKTFLQRYFYRCGDAARIQNDKSSCNSSSSSSSDDDDDDDDSDSSDSSDDDDDPQHQQHQQRSTTAAAAPYRSSSSAWSKNNYRSNARVGPSIAASSSSSDAAAAAGTAGTGTKDTTTNNNNKPLPPSSRRRLGTTSTARAGSERKLGISASASTNTNRRPSRSSFSRTNSIKRSTSGDAASLYSSRRTDSRKKDASSYLKRQEDKQKSPTTTTASTSTSTSTFTQLRRPSLEPPSSTTDQPATMTTTAINPVTNIPYPSTTTTTTTTTTATTMIRPNMGPIKKDAAPVTSYLPSTTTNTWKPNNHPTSPVIKKDAASTNIPVPPPSITSWNRSIGQQPSNHHPASHNNNNKRSSVTTSNTGARLDADEIAKLSVMEKAAVFQQQAIYNPKAASADANSCNSSISTTPHDMTNTNINNGPVEDDIHKGRLVVDTSAAQKELNARRIDTSDHGDVNEDEQVEDDDDDSLSAESFAGDKEDEQEGPSNDHHKPSSSYRPNNKSTKPDRSNNNKPSMRQSLSRAAKPNRRQEERSIYSSAASTTQLQLRYSRKPETTSVRQAAVVPPVDQTTRNARPSINDIKKRNMTWAVSSRSIKPVKIPTWLKGDEEEGPDTEQAPPKVTAIDDSMILNPLQISNHSVTSTALTSSQPNGKTKKSWKTKLALWEKRDTVDTNKEIRTDKEDDGTTLLTKSKKKTWSGTIKITSSDDEALRPPSNHEAKKKTKSWAPSAWGAKLPPWVKPGKSSTHQSKQQPPPPESDHTTGTESLSGAVEEGSQSTAGAKLLRKPSLDVTGDEEEVPLNDEKQEDAKDSTTRSNRSSLNSGSDDEGGDNSGPRRWAGSSASKRRTKSGMNVNIRQLAERSVVRAERRRNAAETYTRCVNLSNLSEEEASDYKDFAANFKLRNWEDDIEIALAKYHVVSSYYKKLVPSSVEKNDFWVRYFFRCDEKRMLCVLRNKTNAGNKTNIDRRVLDRADSQDDLLSQSSASSAQKELPKPASSRSRHNNNHRRTTRREPREVRDARSASPKPPTSRRRPTTTGPSIRERQKSFERKHHNRKSVPRTGKSSGGRDGSATDSSTNSRDNPNESSPVLADNAELPSRRGRGSSSSVSRARHSNYGSSKSQKNGAVKDRIKAFSTTRNPATLVASRT